MQKLTHEQLAAARAKQDWTTLWQIAEPLVKFTIKRMRERGEAYECDWEELLQEGMLAAGEAMRRWDSSAGTFGAFTVSWTRGRLLDYLNSQPRVNDTSPVATETLACDSPLPEFLADEQSVLRLLDRLESYERLVVAHIYGLNGTTQYSVEQFASAQAVSVRTVQRTLEGAIAKMRDA